ncbi:MAG: penicillin-binding transpeptidase domain-containing protein [Oscillospiraceae bacterium]
MSKGPSLKMKKSMIFILSIIVLIGYTTVIGRLFFLQIIDNEKYQQLAINQQLLDTSITAERGTIYDKNMKPLAKSASVWTVYISPREVKKDKIDLLAEGLGQILEVEKDSILKKAEKNNAYEVIKRKVEKPEIDKIRDFKTENKLSGIHIAEDSKRYYPYGDFAASILGFTGNDNQGLAGIEAYYDKYLKGVDGRIVTAKNARGTELPFEYEKFYEPVPGNDIILTIDETIQHYLEKNLYYAVKEHNVANKGAGIVMNVKTGEILAMSTKPDFDPNSPFDIYDPIKSAEIDALPEDQRKSERAKEQQRQWRNKLVSDLYEPGSVFKIVTAAAALEENVVQLNTPFNCAGHLTISGVVIRCNKLEGHGPQNFSDGFKNSCNPVFMITGENLGKDKFYKYFESFGMTEKTGVDLPGEEQSVFYKADKTGPVELASQSFGQSNKVTPIQMATAVATAVNGGKLVQPHIVDKVVDKDGNSIYENSIDSKRQVVSEETSKEILEMMERVISESPGSKNAKILGYRLGGKSGTSQKLDGDASSRIASFVAVAPIEDPEILTLIILDEPNSYSVYGSVLAAPVAGNVLSDILPYMGILPNYTEEELKNKEISVPSLIGDNMTTANENARKQGLKVKKVGNGDVVVSQFPRSGYKVSLGSTIVIYTEEKSEEYTDVPDLNGMSIDTVIKSLSNKGLNLEIEGDHKLGDKVFASRQSIAPGETVDLGTVIKVAFVNKDSYD